MTKAELRKTYLQKRKSITESEFHKFNYQIYEQFFSLSDLSFIKIVHSYLPIAKNKEPDTWPIIDRLRREFPHIHLCIPKINPKIDLLENFFFEGLHQLEENKLGIKEPKQGIPTEVKKIDFVLVPLLAFDLDGNRVGYGKGYYDKFLSTCRSDCKKVGISFFPPVDKISDIDDQDFKLTSCITPNKTYSFLS
jgi:5-formyltetrahydrofolate cyclo-ligase